MERRKFELEALKLLVERDVSFARAARDRDWDWREENLTYALSRRLPTDGG